MSRIETPTSPSDNLRPATRSKWLHLVGFAALWPVLVTGLAAFQFLNAGRSLEDGRADTLVILALGRLLGACFALAFSALIGLFRPQPSARFAAMFIGLTAGTVGFSAFLHFLDYRSFYAQYHSPTFKYWVGEQIMTGAGSAYIFIVYITPLLLPWGVVLLL